jgi:quercetin dioxygenase-like cupin family protein
LLTNLPFDTAPPVTPQPGITTRRVDLHQMTVFHYTFEPGARFPIHHHTEEQLVVVLSGVANFTAEGQAYSLKAGDSLHAAPNVPHGCTSGPEGCTFLNILAPRREAGSVIHYT